MKTESYISICIQFPSLFPQEIFYYLKSNQFYIALDFCPYHTNTTFTKLFTCNNQTGLLRSTRLPLVRIFQSFWLSMYNQEKTLRCKWCPDDRRDHLNLLCNLKKTTYHRSDTKDSKAGFSGIFSLKGVCRLWHNSSRWKNQPSSRMT